MIIFEFKFPQENYIKESKNQNAKKTFDNHMMCYLYSIIVLMLHSKNKGYGITQFNFLNTVAK